MNRRMFFGRLVAGTGAIAINPEVKPEPIREGDVLVIETDDHLSAAAIERLSSQVQRQLGIKALVFEGGMKARLLRPEAAEAFASKN